MAYDDNFDFKPPQNRLIKRDMEVFFVKNRLENDYLQMKADRYTMCLQSGASD